MTHPNFPAKLAGTDPATWDDADWAAMAMYLFQEADHAWHLLDGIRGHPSFNLSGLFDILRQENRAAAALHQATLALLRRVAKAVEVEKTTGAATGIASLLDEIQGLSTSLRRAIQALEGENEGLKQENLRLKEENLRLRMEQID